MMKNDNGLENSMTVRLSGSQQGIYLECIAYPESTMYNFPFFRTFQRSSGT